ncbi:MAG TPA: zinc ribbon domain-containing protein [Pyrinomonadaceae bacterium]|nr:zinc ribbon domain-containing protein [Pyrinomonadaceae bacterium]
MYCPKCGTQNVDDASFCRGCGANVSLVPQALTGTLPEAVAEGGRRRSKRHRDERREGPPSLTYALVKTLVGIAFVLVAFSVKDVFQIAGHIWWFWMLIPAAGSLGAGIAEFVRLTQGQKQPARLTGGAYMPPAMPHVARGGELPTRNTSDIYAPASVTENTTKLLEKDQ